MNKFTIDNEYGYKNYSYLKKVLNGALKHEKVTNAMFSVIFVDEADKEIAKGLKDVKEGRVISKEDAEEIFSKELGF